MHHQDSSCRVLLVRRARRCEGVPARRRANRDDRSLAAISRRIEDHMYNNYITKIDLRLNTYRKTVSERREVLTERCRPRGGLREVDVVPAVSTAFWPVPPTPGRPGTVSWTALKTAHSRRSYRIELLLIVRPNTRCPASPCTAVLA